MKLETKRESRRKDLFFQWIRGLCIIIVVLMHCKESATIEGWELGYWTIMRQMTNFAVATFVFMAGYFTKLHKIFRGGYWIRLIRLIVPYILWSLFYCLINGVLSPLNVLNKIIQGTASVQLYFMIVIIELTILTPLLWESVEHKLIRSVILLITPLYMLLISFIQYGGGIAVVWKGRDFAAWITFYYMGMITQRYGWRIKVGVSKAVVYVLVALALSIMEGIIIFRTLGSPNLAISQLKISSFLFALSVINLFLSLHNNAKIDKNNWLVKIGDMSFGIFFIHPFIIRCENYIMKYLGILEIIALPICHIVQVSLTVCICSMIIMMIKRIDRSRKFSWIIGI